MSDTHAAADSKTTRVDSSPADSSVNKAEAKKEDEEGNQHVLTSVLEYIMYSAMLLNVIFVSVVAIVVAAFVFKSELMLELVFMNRLATPFFSNLSDTSSFGLQDAENLYLDGDQGKLGAWFVKAQHQSSHGDIFALYLHGNAGTRGSSHRVATMQKLSQLGFHVLAIDYRGYGDSDGWPTEPGLVRDALAAHEWLHQKAGTRPVYVVGHSLGSSVALQLAGIANEEKTLRLNGMLLLAPFKNLLEVVRSYTLAKLLERWIPNCMELIKDMFRNEIYILKTTVPTLILHSAADGMIDIDQSKKLHQVAKRVASTNVRFEEVPVKLGHDQLHDSDLFDSGLMELVAHTA